jgi:hypothetical protein
VLIRSAFPPLPKTRRRWVLRAVDLEVSLLAASMANRILCSGRCSAASASSSTSTSAGRVVTPASRLAYDERCGLEKRVERLRVRHCEELAQRVSVPSLFRGDVHEQLFEETESDIEVAWRALEAAVLPGAGDEFLKLTETLPVHRDGGLVVVADEQRTPELVHQKLSASLADDVVPLRDVRDHDVA